MTARLLTEEGCIIELDRSECACTFSRHPDEPPVPHCLACRRRIERAANGNGERDPHNGNESA